MSFETAVQTVIYQLLSADPALTALVKGVYDDVPEDPDLPQDQIFPYVTIGESIHNESDTVSVLGDDVSTIVHTWSRYRGRKETKQIQGAIYDALHRANGTYSGYDIISIDWENSQSFIDQDGLTRHGVQSFRVLIDKT